jgi:hypothetical protein
LNIRLKLPPMVERLYEIVAELEASYPGRTFTPDGHLVGSLGEVVAAEALGLTLHRASYKGHDAADADGRLIQIKMTGRTGRSVAIRETCDRLVVLKVVSTREAEIVYDGDGAPAWEAAYAMQRNGQRTLPLSRLIAAQRR